MPPWASELRNARCHAQAATRCLWPGLRVRLVGYTRGTASRCARCFRADHAGVAGDAKRSGAGFCQISSPCTPTDGETVMHGHPKRASMSAAS